MADVFDLTERLRERAEEENYADAEELLERILSLDFNTVMIIMKVGDSLKYQIMRASRFIPEID